MQATRHLILCFLGVMTALGSANAWGQEAASSIAPSSKGDRTSNWPNWMGPMHDGISTEAGWSSAWPEDGLTVKWTANLGTGFSSFSVVDGLVYSMGHSDGKETVWCLDAESGRKIWSHSYPAVLNPNLYEGGPGSTPTVHSNMVFTLSIDGRLIGFRRKTGENRLGSRPSERIRSRHARMGIQRVALHSGKPASA